MITPPLTCEDVMTSEKIILLYFIHHKDETFRMKQQALFLMNGVGGG